VNQERANCFANVLCKLFDTWHPLLYSGVKYQKSEVASLYGFSFSLWDKYVLMQGHSWYQR